MNYMLDRNLRYKQMLTSSVKNVGILTFVVKGSIETLSAFSNASLFQARWYRHSHCWGERALWGNQGEATGASWKPDYTLPVGPIAPTAQWHIALLFCWKLKKTPNLFSEQVLFSIWKAWRGIEGNSVPSWKGKIFVAQDKT